jgi:D-3-phosphoglycerate dehydrogenase
VKIVLAEKVSPATLAVFQAEPGWNVVTHDQIKDGLASELKDADGLVVRSAVQVDDAVRAWVWITSMRKQPRAGASW